MWLLQLGLEQSPASQYSMEIDCLSTYHCWWCLREREAPAHVQQCNFIIRINPVTHWLLVQLGELSGVKQPCGSMRRFHVPTYQRLWWSACQEAEVIWSWLWKCFCSSYGWAASRGLRVNSLDCLLWEPFGLQPWEFQDCMIGCGV